MVRHVHVARCGAYLDSVVHHGVEAQDRHVVAKIVVSQHADGVKADNFPVLVLRLRRLGPAVHEVQQGLLVVAAALVHVALAERDVHVQVEEE